MDKSADSVEQATKSVHGYGHTDEKSDGYHRMVLTDVNKKSRLCPKP